MDALRRDSSRPYAQRLRLAVDSVRKHGLSSLHSVADRFGVAAAAVKNYVTNKEQYNHLLHLCEDDDISSNDAGSRSDLESDSVVSQIHKTTCTKVVGSFDNSAVKRFGMKAAQQIGSEVDNRKLCASSGSLVRTFREPGAVRLSPYGFSYRVENKAAFAALDAVVHEGLGARIAAERFGVKEKVVEYYIDRAKEANQCDSIVKLREKFARVQTGKLTERGAAEILTEMKRSKTSFDDEEGPATAAVAKPLPQRVLALKGVPKVAVKSGFKQSLLSPRKRGRPPNMLKLPKLEIQQCVQRVLDGARPRYPLQAIRDALTFSLRHPAVSVQDVGDRYGIPRETLRIYLNRARGLVGEQRKSHIHKQQQQASPSSAAEPSTMSDTTFSPPPPAGQNSADASVSKPKKPDKLAGHNPHIVSRVIDAVVKKKCHHSAGNRDALIRALRAIFVRGRSVDDAAKRFSLGRTQLKNFDLRVRQALAGGSGASLAVQKSVTRKVPRNHPKQMTEAQAKQAKAIEEDLQLLENSVHVTVSPVKDRRNANVLPTDDMWRLQSGERWIPPKSFEDHFRGQPDSSRLCNLLSADDEANVANYCRMLLKEGMNLQPSFATAMAMEAAKKYGYSQEQLDAYFVRDWWERFQLVHTLY